MEPSSRASAATLMRMRLETDAHFVNVRDTAERVGQAFLLHL